QQDREPGFSEELGLAIEKLKDGFTLQGLCRHGYVLEQHWYCRANVSFPSLVFSNGRDLLIRDVHGNNLRTLIQSHNRGVAAGVDFHHLLGWVFWTYTVQNK
ncbi:hypothetical protein CRUP_032186, partial [Coryphaenoides rupestris]